MGALKNTAPKQRYIGTTPRPVTVTRIIPFLVGNPELNLHLKTKEIQNLEMQLEERDVNAGGILPVR